MAELWLNFLLLESDQTGTEKEKEKEIETERGNLISSNNVFPSPKGIDSSPSPRNVPQGLIRPGAVIDNTNAVKQPVRSYSFTSSRTNVKEDHTVPVLDQNIVNTNNVNNIK